MRKQKFYMAKSPISRAKQPMKTGNNICNSNHKSLISMTSHRSGRETTQQKKTVNGSNSSDKRNHQGIEYTEDALTWEMRMRNTTFTYQAMIETLEGVGPQVGCTSMGQHSPLQKQTPFRLSNSTSRSLSYRQIHKRAKLLNAKVTHASIMAMATRLHAPNAHRGLGKASCRAPSGCEDALKRTDGEAVFPLLATDLRGGQWKMQGEE